MSKVTAVQRYAVIDIGSNATRLHIAHPDQQNQWITDTFIRIPLPLGAEVFSHPQQSLSVKTITRLEKTIAAMQLIIGTFAPIKTRAVATAALRSAKNSTKIIEQLKNNTDLTVYCLSGEEEATIIGLLAGQQYQNSTVINLDVGGGSTDCAVIRNNQLINQSSFLVGTAHDPTNSADHIKAFCQWIKSAKNDCDVQHLTASGGSIALLKNMCRGTLTQAALTQEQKKLKNMAVGDISRLYNFPPDTVANIEMAIDIYKAALKSSTLPHIDIVQGGLSDAIIYQMLSC